MLVFSPLGGIEGQRIALCVNFREYFELFFKMFAVCLYVFSVMSYINTMTCLDWLCPLGFLAQAHIFCSKMQVALVFCMLVRLATPSECADNKYFFGDLNTSRYR